MPSPRASARLLGVGFHMRSMRPGSSKVSVAILVLVLVLIKDHFTIKRMLTQKASVYPGFILMSVFTT